MMIRRTAGRGVRRISRLAAPLLALAAVRLAAAPPPEGHPPRGAAPEGTWYLAADGQRLTLSLTRDQKPGVLTGTVIDARGQRSPVREARWDPAAHRLEFGREANGMWEWYRATETDGILTGRFSLSAGAAAPAGWEFYSHHVTGWNSTVLDRDLVPRVYELLIRGNYRARLRLDRATDGKLIGRMKVYSTVSGGAGGEELEDDLEVSRWDGRELRFTRRLPSGPQEYQGTAVGRSITGSFTNGGTGEAFPFTGERAEVLTYGLVPKSEAERTRWQEQTRRRLRLLTMAGDPQPLGRTVRVLRGDEPPTPSKAYSPDRDDDPESHPARYRVQELQLDYKLPNPYGGAPLERTVHAYLALPGTQARGGKYPAVLSVNGHGGSAWKMLNPDDPYFWHGDGFARRGYVVLAIDISHRPAEDRRGLYRGSERGDDPDHGNGAHPAVRAPGMDPDWEEDGERAWDAMRALDYLLSLPQVDPKRVLVTGISMGGEVTTYAGALDTRLALSIPVGYSPDMGVMLSHGNHPCWRWQNADIREYVDIPDFHALVAPRPLILQTGVQDYTFSSRREPFAADVQIARRSRAAYGAQADRFLHYLHYDQHHYHVGDVNPAKKGPLGVQLPLLLEPKAPGDRAWQTSAETKTDGRTLFQVVEGFLEQR